MLPLPNKQEILGDPTKLGQFLLYAAEIVELEKFARSQAIDFLLRGKNVPGWILRRHVPSFVSSSALEPIAETSRATLLKFIGTLSERRYRTLCAQCGIEPDLQQIFKAGTTVRLARNNQPRKVIPLCQTTPQE